MSNDVLIYTALISISYLIGSIPFGIVLGKLFKVGDIRSIGSGNIGATNALRTGNKSFALAVLIGDGSKGAIAILVAYLWLGNTVPHAGMIAGLVAIIGHLFPVWLRFKGGKGVATGLGVLLALHWPTGILVAAMWLITAKLSKYSSLGALLSFLQAPIYAKATGADEFAIPFAILAALIFWTHRSNLSRLLKGEESTIKIKQ